MKSYLTWKTAKRLVIGVIGGTVVLIGIVLAPMPVLPGWPIIFIGLGILAVEFVWAALLLKWVKNRVKQTSEGLMQTFGLSETNNAANKNQTNHRDGKAD